MKLNFYKKITIITSGVFLWQFFILPIKSFALDYTPLEGQAFKDFGVVNAKTLPQFLSGAFQFGLAIAAALAVIMIVWGGVEIMLSESVFKKEDGKKKIQDAIWGLVLALVSYLILWTINPNILNFNL